MTHATRQPAVPTPTSFQVFETHARYHAVIDRYVRNRVHDPERAALVLREVHRYAASDAVALAENPLPLLIARARYECAEALTINPLPTGSHHTGRTP
jgi:hypothetical protein